MRFDLHPEKAYGSFPVYICATHHHHPPTDMIQNKTKHISLAAELQRHARYSPVMESLSPRTQSHVVGATPPWIWRWVAWLWPLSLCPHSGHQIPAPEGRRLKPDNHGLYWILLCIYCLLLTVAFLFTFCPHDQNVFPFVFLCPAVSTLHPLILSDSTCSDDGWRRWRPTRRLFLLVYTNALCIETALSHTSVDVCGDWTFCFLDRIWSHKTPQHTGIKRHAKEKHKLLNLF